MNEIELYLESIERAYGNAKAELVADMRRVAEALTREADALESYGDGRPYVNSFGCLQDSRAQGLNGRCAALHEKWEAVALLRVLVKREKAKQG